MGKGLNRALRLGDIVTYLENTEKFPVVSKAAKDLGMHPNTLKQILYEIVSIQKMRQINLIETDNTIVIYLEPIKKIEYKTNIEESNTLIVTVDEDIGQITSKIKDIVRGKGKCYELKN